MFLCPQSLTLTTPSHLTRDDQVKFEMRKLRYAVAERYIYVYVYILKVANNKGLMPGSSGSN